MEIKTTITAIIAAIVALIIVVVVAVPIISDVSEQVHGTAQNTNYRFAFVESDGLDELTIVMDPTTSVISVNDRIKYSGDGNNLSNLCAVYTDVGYLRFNSAQIYGLMGGTIQVSDPVTIEINDGEMTFISGSYVYTKPITWLCYPDPNGKWGTFTGNVNVTTGQTVYLVKGSEYTASDYNTPYSVIATDGTTNTTICSICENKTTGTVSNTTSAGATFTYNAVDEWHGTYSNYKIQTTYGNNVSENATCGIIAPISYYYVTDMDAPIKSIINIVPMLMIVGLIISVVAVFIRTR